MKHRTAEEVCVEYAIAVADVRRISKKFGENPCALIEKWYERNQSTPKPDDCLDVYFAEWDREHENYDSYAEARAAAKDTMCGCCCRRLQAIEDRKEARKRLGAAKRSVEAVGKRLNKAVTA